MLLNGNLQPKDPIPKSSEKKVFKPNTVQSLYFSNGNINLPNVDQLPQNVDGSPYFVYENMNLPLKTPLPEETPFRSRFFTKENLNLLTANPLPTNVDKSPYLNDKSIHLHTKSSNLCKLLPNTEKKVIESPYFSNEKMNLQLENTHDKKLVQSPYFKENKNLESKDSLPLKNIGGSPYFSKDSMNLHSEKLITECLDTKVPQISCFSEKNMILQPKDSIPKSAEKKIVRKPYLHDENMNLQLKDPLPENKLFRSRFFSKENMNLLTVDSLPENVDRSPYLNDKSMRQHSKSPNLYKLLTNTEKKIIKSPYFSEEKINLQLENLPHEKKLVKSPYLSKENMNLQLKDSLPQKNVCGSPYFSKDNMNLHSEDPITECFDKKVAQTSCFSKKNINLHAKDPILKSSKKKVVKTNTVESPYFSKNMNLLKVDSLPQNVDGNPYFNYESMNPQSKIPSLYKLQSNNEKKVFKSPYFSKEKVDIQVEDPLPEKKVSQNPNVSKETRNLQSEDFLPQKNVTGSPYSKENMNLQSKDPIPTFSVKKVVQSPYFIKKNLNFHSKDPIPKFSKKKVVKKNPVRSPYFSKKYVNILSVNPLPEFFRWRRNAWKPPKSPYHLIQEDLYHKPWQLLVATIFLQKTTGTVVKNILMGFFSQFPTPEALLSSNVAIISEMLKPIGLQNRKAKTILRFSYEYLHLHWRRPISLHGIGKYGNDSYRIFCVNEWKEVTPKDHMLVKYHNWLKEYFSS